MPLTYGRIEKLVADRTRGRHADGAGLMLVVGAGGSASWVLRIMANGRRRDVGLGGYPAVSLSQARSAADRMRQAFRAGQDPVAERKRATAVPTFSEAAAAALACKAPRWKGGRDSKVARDWMRSLERYVFPRIGNVAVTDITRADVIDTLAPLGGAPVGRAVRQRIRAAMRWAQARGLRDDNPAVDIDAALEAPPREVEHHRALPFAEVGAALRAVDATAASEPVKLALRWLTLTASRSAETTGATWAEVDLQARVWTIPPSRMKSGREHRVPLSRAALAVLEQAAALRDSTGLLFPSPYRRGGPLDGKSLRNALKLAGMDATPHGQRTAFRTWCQETGVPWDVAELSLAHRLGDATVSAYARSDELERRRPIMEAWAEAVTS